MIARRFNVFLFFSFNILLWMILLGSCGKSNPELHIKNTNKIFNLRFLRGQTDSIGLAIVNQDSLKIESIISYFNDTSLACQHPDLVFHAYYMAYAGNRDSEMADFKNFPNKLQNFYNRFKALADKSACETMQAYAEYIIGRNFNELDSNAKAMPLLLRSVDRFNELGQSYGYSLAAKRVGLCYLYSYKDYLNASKYLKLSINDTFDLNNQSKGYMHLIQCYFYLQQYDSLKKYVDLHLNSSQIEIGFNKDFNQTYYHTYKYIHDINGNLDSARKYFDPFFKLHLDFPIPYYYKPFMTFLSVFSNSLLEKKEYNFLGNIIKTVSAFELTHKDYVGMSDEFYEVCYRYYEATNDFVNYHLYLRRFVEASQNIAFESQKRKVELAKIEYDVEKERENLTNDFKQKENLALQQIQKQKIIRNSFIAGSILLLLLIVVLINRNKLKRTVEMEKMRSRLSRDLHDDIGSTLSSINILSRTAQNNLKQSNDEKTKASLEKINERSQRLLDNMSDIIWNINPGNDTIEEVMSRMREYATTILEAKNIDYTFDFPKEKMDCKLSMEVKNNMYLIFKETVNNLSKYAGCSHANLSLTYDEKNIHLKIEDNGVGFNQEGVMHRGGLVNMQHRAEEIKGVIKINSSAGNGTSIELTMPRYC